jgi:hypothetical protein
LSRLIRRHSPIHSLPLMFGTQKVDTATRQFCSRHSMQICTIRRPYIPLTIPPFAHPSPDFRNCSRAAQDTHTHTHTHTHSPFLLLRTLHCWFVCIICTVLITIVVTAVYYIRSRACVCLAYRSVARCRRQRDEIEVDLFGVQAHVVLLNPRSRDFEQVLLIRHLDATVHRPLPPSIQLQELPTLPITDEADKVEVHWRVCRGGGSLTLRRHLRVHF